MPYNKLKVLIIPHDIVWGDKIENLLSIEHLLSKVDNNVDIVVLPELFTTGLLSNIEMVSNLSETNTSKTIEIIKTWAKKYNFAICGSYIASCMSKYYNRAFFIEPSGEETFYDKKYLSLINGECDLFEPGLTVPHIIRYRGWNIKLIIGEDLYYPVWCGNSYDALVVVANTSKAKSIQWRHMLIARAIENQAYVIGANRTGHDDFGMYQYKDSIMVNYLGEFNMQSNNTFVYAELDYDSLSQYRAQNPLWKNDGQSIL
ncbi:MAG: nitrilase family protein [Muribaculaceae bacterium]|nr:nitrilase family protein [Muribaculaceae bacterium]